MVSFGNRRFDVKFDDNSVRTSVACRGLFSYLKSTDVCWSAYENIGADAQLTVNGGPSVNVEHEWELGQSLFHGVINGEKITVQVPRLISW